MSRSVVLFHQQPGGFVPNIIAIGFDCNPSNVCWLEHHPFDEVVLPRDLAWLVAPIISQLVSFRIGVADHTYAFHPIPNVQHLSRLKLSIEFLRPWQVLEIVLCNAEKHSHVELVWHSSLIAELATFPERPGPDRSFVKGVPDVALERLGIVGAAIPPGHSFHECLPITMSVQGGGFGWVQFAIVPVLRQKEFCLILTKVFWDVLQDLKVPL